MGIVLHSIYNRDEFIINEFSIKNPTLEELEILEKSKLDWSDGIGIDSDVSIIKEGNITTLKYQYPINSESQKIGFIDFMLERI